MLSNYFFDVCIFLSFLHTALIIPRRIRPEFISRLMCSPYRDAKRFLRFIRIKTSTMIGHVRACASRWTSSIAPSSRTYCWPLCTTPNDKRMSERWWRFTLRCALHFDRMTHISLTSLVDLSRISAHQNTSYVA